MFRNALVAISRSACSAVKVSQGRREAVCGDVVVDKDYKKKRRYVLWLNESEPEIRKNYWECRRIVKRLRTVSERKV